MNEKHVIWRQSAQEKVHVGYVLGRQDGRDLVYLVDSQVNLVDRPPVDDQLISRDPLELPQQLSEDVKAEINDGQVDVGRLDELQIDLDEADLVGLDEMVPVFLQVSSQTVRPMNDSRPEFVEQD